MNRFGLKAISILARTQLLKSALEDIASDLQLQYETVEDASSVSLTSGVVLLSFTCAEGLFSDIDALLERPEAPHIVLFPLDPSLLESLPELPKEVAAVVSPNMLAGEIKSVISLVADGHRIVSYDSESGLDDTSTAPRNGRLKLLTDRQLEILEQLALGQSNKKIARNLNISVNTVEAHVSNVIRKLKVGNRTQAALALGGVSEAREQAELGKQSYDLPASPRARPFRTIIGGASSTARLEP